MASATVAGSQGLSISKPVSSPWMIAVSVMLATFMEVLDTSIASVALALHRRQPVGHQRRSYLGAHQLPGRECHRAAGQYMVLAEIRTQALSHHLHHHLHGFVIRLRSRLEPARPS